MSKRIPLGKGKFAVVDNEDYPYLSRFKWCFIRKNGGVSLNKNSGINKTMMIPMTTFIITKKPNYKVFFKNKNPFDLRKCNLVVLPYNYCITQYKKRKGTTTKFKGVYYYKNKKKNPYSAVISKDRVKFWLGSYKTIKEAVIVYNEKARELYGEFAYQNKV